MIRRRKTAPEPVRRQEPIYRWQWEWSTGVDYGMPIAILSAVGGVVVFVIVRAVATIITGAPFFEISDTQFAWGVIAAAGPFLIGIVVITPLIALGAGYRSIVGYREVTE